MSWQHVVDIVSLICVFFGTYLVTKVTFVDMMVREFELGKKVSDYNWLIKILCKQWYFISENDLPRMRTGQKRAVTIHEPFFGFIWIATGSLLQVAKIVASAIFKQ